MKKYSAFSLIEISIVILVIGILIAGITHSSIMVKNSKLQTARSLTQNSPVVDTENLALWYETSLESSFLKSEEVDDAKISAWYDNNPKAIVKNNAIQATSANQPKFIVNTLNGGIPVIRFDGTNDSLAYDGTFLAGSNYTIFVVEQRLSDTSSNYFMGGSGSSINTNLGLGYGTNTTITQAHYSNDFDVATITGYSNPVARIHTFWFSDSGGKKYWMNGGSATTSAGQTAALVSYAGATVGARSSNYFNGDVAEIIIFTRALKTAEKQLIETYLGRKYNITIG